MKELKAISINQPWAWLIVNGFKDIENRNWETKYRGALLIHTGRKVDKDFNYAYWEILINREIPRDLFTGGVIGMVNVVGCVKRSKSPWFFGRYGFVLENQSVFKKPRPCKGFLGLFTPDYNLKYKNDKHPLTLES